MNPHDTLTSYEEEALLTAVLQYAVTEQRWPSPEEQEALRQSVLHARS